MSLHLTYQMACKPSNLQLELIIMAPSIQQLICDALELSWYKVFRTEEIIETIANTQQPEKASH